MKNPHDLISKSVIGRAFADTFPIMTGYIVLGFGFGFILRSNGYELPLTLFMSLFIYAGSMQYAAVGLLTGGASLFTVAAATLMINIRHLFYGISMIDKYRDIGRAKPYLIFSLTDETYSLVCGEHDDIPPEKRRYYYLTVSLLDHIYWVIGSLLGASIGGSISLDSTGIDFALTALFLTIFIDQWLSSKDHKPALIGVSVSAVCRVLFGSKMFLIPTMILLTAIFYFYREGRSK